ncbi:hypothetical protein C1646_808793 [Rhizophagus diaphanus]|nr:hypothetical protein C1646_808793 [Rhizophagus diaphanus] [Rhizophagus sp. MUCL 43196]
MDQNNLQNNQNDPMFNLQSTAEQHNNNYVIADSSDNISTFYTNHYSHQQPTYNENITSTLPPGSSPCVHGLQQTIENTTFPLSPFNMNSVNPSQSEILSFDIPGTGDILTKENTIIKEVLGYQLSTRDEILPRARSAEDLKTSENNSEGKVEVLLSTLSPSPLPINNSVLTREDLAKPVENLFGQIKWVFDSQNRITEIIEAGKNRIIG